MGIKSRIAVISCAILLVISVMFVGVFASVKVTSSSNGGGFSYKANDVYADITISNYDGTKEPTIQLLPGNAYIEQTLTLKPFSFNPTESQAGSAEGIAAASKKSFSVTVLNNGVRPLAIDISRYPTTVGPEQVLVTYTYTSKTNDVISDAAPVVDGEAGVVIIPSNSSYTITVSAQLLDWSKDVQAELGFSMDLATVLDK